MSVSIFRRRDAATYNPHGWEFFVPIPDGVDLPYGIVVVPFPQGDWSAYHAHPDAEVLILSLDGRAEGIIGRRPVTVKPGDYIFLPPGTPHKWRTTSDEPWISLGIHFPPVYETDDLSTTGTTLLKEARE